MLNFDKEFVMKKIVFVLVFAVILTSVSAQYFDDPVWLPSGFQNRYHDFFVAEAKINGVDMQPGTEVAVFMGEIVVGRHLVTAVADLNDASTYFTPQAGKEDPNDPGSGYIQNQPIIFKIWSCWYGEHTLTVTDIDLFFGPDTFADDGETWITFDAQISEPDVMVWNAIESFYEFTTASNLNLKFTPLLGGFDGEIAVYNTDDPNEPSVQDFPRPSALGQFFRFVFAEPSLLGEGGDFTLQFNDPPINIWYRTDGDWETIPWSAISGPIAPNYSYTVDLDLVFGRYYPYGLCGIEFAGDDGVQTLPVELSSFTANVTANMFVELQWTAETETNMLGYNVYRAETNSISEASKANFVIIPAHNASTSIDYTFVDSDVEEGMMYYYWLQSNDLDLTHEFHGPISVEVVQQGQAGDSIPGIGLVTELIGNYPNPFNPSTTISFSLAEQTPVTIEVFNVLGQKMQTLVSGETYSRGTHSVYWDGKDMYGRDAASGIYLYKMETETDERMIKRMLLLK